MTTGITSGAARPALPEEDGDRFIEIWNLVFMQFEQFEDGTRKDLAAQSIDTGMGLERIGALLQGKHDNYDTDLMRSLIEASANASNVDPDGPKNVHHRVIADHLRSVSFLIADGVMPSNEGRGYVLRRIMRRAMRHAHLLGVQDPLMYRLVPALVAQMGQAYPELGPRAGADHRDAEAGGGAVPHHARPGAEASGR
jgi:alanyl-tRNA synthetase